MRSNYYQIINGMAYNLVIVLLLLPLFVFVFGLPVGHGPHHLLVLGLGLLPLRLLHHLPDQGLDADCHLTNSNPTTA